MCRPPPISGSTSQRGKRERERERAAHAASERRRHGRRVPCRPPLQVVPHQLSIRSVPHRPLS